MLVVALLVFFCGFIYLNKKSNRISFCTGWLFAWSTMSLQQDALGRDGYAQYVLDNWQDGAWTIPFAIAWIFVAMFIMNSLNREKS